MAIALIGNPSEINMAFNLPYLMVSSDAGIYVSEDGLGCHPQDAGTFPRFIRELVVLTQQLMLIDAVIVAGRIAVEKGSVVNAKAEEHWPLHRSCGNFNKLING